MISPEDTWVVIKSHDFATTLGSTRLMNEYTARREATKLNLAESRNYRGQASLRWFYQAVRLEM